MAEDRLQMDLKLRGERTVALVVTCSCGTTIVDMETDDLNIDAVKANPEQAWQFMDALLCQHQKDRVDPLVCEGCGRIIPAPPNTN